MSEKIYGIRDKGTKSFERFNNKTCWASVAAAKSSFTASQSKWEASPGRWTKPKFDEQDIYEIVELTDYVFMYEGLDK